MVIDNVNARKLLQELADVSIEWDNAVIVGDSEIIVVFRDDVNMELVQQIIDAHDPLASVKDSKIKELNDTCNKTVLGRFKAIIGDIEYEFSYDYDAQLRFTGIGVMFNAGKLKEIEWTAYLNSVRVRIALNQDNFDVVTLAALYHQNYNVTKFNQLLQQVNTATTKEQIEAIVWDE